MVKDLSESYKTNFGKEVVGSFSQISGKDELLSDALGLGALDKWQDDLPDYATGSLDEMGSWMDQEFWPLSEGKRRGALPETLGSVLGERGKLLRERLDVLLSHRKKRRDLHKKIQHAIEGDIEQVDFLLDEVKIWSLGYNASVDSRRTNLEREVLTLKKLGLEEDLRHWRDSVWLEKELQETLERYKLVTAAKGIRRKGDE